MPRKPFGAGLPRWASGKACPAKATPTTTLWRRTFSAASNVNWFPCANMTPAVLLKRIFSPISRPFTTRCARIPPLTGSHRALLNCGCVMPLSPDLRDFTYYCDSFRFSALFTVYFFGKGSYGSVTAHSDKTHFLWIILRWQSLHTTSVFLCLAIIAISHRSLPLRFLSLLMW